MVFGRQCTLWTELDVQYLRENYGKMSVQQLAESLGREHGSIQQKLFSLKLYKPTLTIAPIQLTDVEWAYIAGIIDGEGYLRIEKRIARDKRGSSGYTRVYLLPYIGVSNTDEELMKWLHKRLGGSYIRNGMTTRQRPMYNLIINTVGRVYPVLQQVMPYLIIKRRHAEVLQAFCKNRLVRQKQNSPYMQQDYEYYKQMRVLNSHRKKVAIT